ncbi:hypothetical protein C2S51_005229 [Perilla frutescens var. frutescens]|nr:hypothetical protein C2S51_005229 [Perilla frutescens var. frutescens]
MSCIHITACQFASSPSASPVPSSQHSKASTIPLIHLRTKTKFPKLHLKLTSATSRYQRAATVCLFGGKGKSDNGNEGSPWKAIENAMGNFKKEESVESLLRQQIQKQEYFDDGGTTGKPPGGGGGGGDGFGEAEDGNLSGMWDEFGQVILATVGFVFLYIYIIEGEEITVIAKDTLRYLFKRQKSIRLNRLIEQWEDFFKSMKEKPVYDPYWLEREILNTRTLYDSPDKYNYIIKALDRLESASDDRLESTSDDEQY